MIFFGFTVFIIIFSTFSCSISNEFCDAMNRDENCSAKNVSKLTARYIFYDVNPSEGFNLRRDVYMRMAVFARRLKEENWFLVLPPWPHLYHWRSESIFPQSRLPWSLFFNLTKLSSFAPVIEMSEFLETGQTNIEQVYILQHFEDTFTMGNFKDRMKVEPCENPALYERTPKGFVGHFWGYANITARKVDCLSFHGPATQLVNILKNSQVKTVMFDNAEIALHERFGDKTYWDARKSMKFADHLIQEAEKFRKRELNSTNATDKTMWPNNKRNAIGGDYVCVHLRRRDFLSGRAKEIPNIKGAAAQIEKVLNEMRLKTVFIATDAPEKEKAELKLYLDKYKILFYKPSEKIKSNYKDGGIAIIEQIICSHARKFLGSHESTFSFRIQEEREIMGFPPETTFNRLCGEEEVQCRPPSKWLILN